MLHNHNARRAIGEKKEVSDGIVSQNDFCTKKIRLSFIMSILRNNSKNDAYIKEI